MALIELHDVHKAFQVGGEIVRALDGVSLEIREGELLAITGPSGSGKSTLMNILGLLDVPSSGQYRLNGKLIRDLKDDELAAQRNRNIGFVFQAFHLLPRITTLRNVEMPLVYSAAYGLRRSRTEMRALAVEALTRVGLQDRMNHRPNELSGGQRQRAAIARALVNKPKILLADEPTGNLDSQTGREIIELFERLNQEGVTVIVVTHETGLARKLRRIIRVLDGKIAEDTSNHAAA